jgi:hypothetical protein
MTYTIEAAAEYGPGASVNGTGRRVKVSGFFVVDGNGRRVRAFTGKDAEKKAQEWAEFCTENLS